MRSSASSDTSRKFDAGEFSSRVRTFLESHTASELPLQAPIFLDEFVDPNEAFKFLAEKKIRACPVKCETDGFKIIGCLDQRDAVLDVLDGHRLSCSDCRGLFHSLSSRSLSFKERAKENKDKEKSSSQRSIKEGHALPRTSSFHYRTPSNGRVRRTSSTPSTTQVLNSDQAIGVRTLAASHPFRVIPPSARLMQLTDVMSAGEYLVGITGGPPEKCGLKGMVDQITFVNFLQPLFEGIDIQVKDIFKNIVLPVHPTDTTVKSFELMVSKGSTAVAVVDETGALTHNFSTSDIKVYFDEGCKLDVLHLPVEDYLARKEELKETKDRKDTKAPISVCHPDDDLHTVIARLVKTGYHRVWVVDIDRKPLGILSLTDVFRKVHSALHEELPGCSPGLGDRCSAQ